MSCRILGLMLIAIFPLLGMHSNKKNKSVKLEEEENIICLNSETKKMIKKINSGKKYCFLFSISGQYFMYSNMMNKKNIDYFFKCPVKDCDYKYNYSYINHGIFTKTLMHFCNIHEWELIDTIQINNTEIFKILIPEKIDETENK